MLTDHPAGVLAGRPRLGAEAPAHRRHPHRQGVLIKDLAGDQICQRHLGGRNEPAAVGGPKQVVAELRQLAGAENGVVAHQRRRTDLGVAELARVQVEHEGGQRPFQPGKRPLENDESGAGQLDRPLEIHQSERFAEVKMLLRRKGERRRIAPAAQFDVRGCIGAVGNVGGRRIGQRRQGQVECAFGLPGLLLGGGLLILGAADQCEQVARVLAAALPAADFLGRRIPPCLDLLDERQRLATLPIEGEKLGRRLGSAPSAERIVERLRVVADPLDIEHARRRLEGLRCGLTDGGGRVKPWAAAAAGKARDCDYSAPLAARSTDPSCGSMPLA